MLSFKQEHEIIMPNSVYFQYARKYYPESFLFILFLFKNILKYLISLLFGLFLLVVLGQWSIFDNFCLFFLIWLEIGNFAFNLFILVYCS